MVERTENIVKRILRLARNASALLLMLWVVFIALQLVGATVPDRAVAQQLQNSIAAGLYERSYPPNGIGGVHDSYTDCVVAGTGLGEAGMSIGERALLMPRIASCTNGGVRDIERLAAGEDTAHQLYLRYWAGYTALFRPALAIGGMAAMNAVAATALILGAIAMWSQLARRASTTVVAGFALPLWLTSDALLTGSGSAEHALSLGVAFGGVALIARLGTRGASCLFLAAIACGAVFNFFDLLNNPNLAWVMTAGAATVCLAAAGRGARDIAAGGLAAAGGWMVGFAGSFVARWVIALLVAGPDVALEQIADNIATRSGLGDQSAYAVEQGLGQATWANLSYYLNMPLAPLGAFCVVILTVVCVATACVRRGAGALFLFFVTAAPAIVVPIWYEVMSNHSQVHDWFVYRAVPAALGVMAAAAIAVARPPVDSSPPGLTS